MMDDILESNIPRWRRNPVAFAYEVFGLILDKWQQQALMALVSNDPVAQRISLQACAGPGKSLVLAVAALWFMTCFGYEGDHPQGACVAITGENLRDNLWKEIAKWLNQSDLMRSKFEINSSRLSARSHPDTWFMSARTWSKSASPEEQGRTLSGLHSGYILALIDESGDMPPSVLRAAEQALSTKPKFGKIMQAGNPTSTDGMLYLAATRLAHEWTVIRITGDPDDPMRSTRVDIDWARSQIKNYGRDNPWVQAYILGQFPPAGFNQLLGPDEVRRAMERSYSPGDIEHAQKRIGVDAARFGDDPWVFFPRHGLVAYKPLMLRGMRTQDIAARLMLGKKKFGSEMEFIDGSGGYGAGVIDAMVVAGHDPQEVYFSGKAADPRYFNKRSEMWFLMADWVREKGQLPQDEQLMRELTTATYTFQNGKFRLEEKDQIKKRLGYSPNLADALCLTFAMEEMPSMAYQQQSDKVERYNPLQKDDEYHPFSRENML